MVVRLTVQRSGASGGETHRTEVRSEWWWDSPYRGPVRVVVRLTVHWSSASGGETHRTEVLCEWW